MTRTRKPSAHLFRLPLTVSYVTMNAVQQVWAAPPGLHISLGRRIYPEATGYISK